MSVGVCVINRNGIALAADSAGTSPGNKMFYNSMNKVFSLSKRYVYGAITYGMSSVYNVSVEQLLKEFRAFLDSQECVNDFFDILDKFVEFISIKNDYFRFNQDEFASCNSLIKALVVDWGNKIKSVIGAGLSTAGGVAVGAKVGSLISPGWGTLAGVVVGGLIGWAYDALVDEPVKEYLVINVIEGD